MRHALALLLLYPALALSDENNFGIGPRDKFATREKVTYQGRELTMAGAIQILEARDQLPDDVGKPWLIYVGRSKEEATKTRALLAPLLGKCRVQTCVEGEWYTRKRDGSVRFVPGATVLLADGTEVARTEDLPGLLHILLNLAADFDWRRLPDLLRPKPPPTPLPAPGPGPGPDAWPWWVWVGGTALVLWLFSKRGK